MCFENRLVLFGNLRSPFARIPPRCQLKRCSVMDLRHQTQIPRRGGPLCTPVRFAVSSLFGWSQSCSALACRIQKLRVRADRCVRPCVSIIEYSCLVMSVLRLRGRCLAIAPKSPVFIEPKAVGGHSFVSRLSRSTFHRASRCDVVLL